MGIVLSGMLSDVVFLLVSLCLFCLPCAGLFFCCCVVAVVLPFLFAFSRLVFCFFWIYCGMGLLGLWDLLCFPLFGVLCLLASRPIIILQFKKKKIVEVCLLCLIVICLVCLNGFAWCV